MQARTNDRPDASSRRGIPAYARRLTRMGISIAQMRGLSLPLQVVLSAGCSAVGEAMGGPGRSTIVRRGRGNRGPSGAAVSDLHDEPLRARCRRTFAILAGARAMRPSESGWAGGVSRPMSPASTGSGCRAQSETGFSPSLPGFNGKARAGEARASGVTICETGDRLSSRGAACGGCGARARAPARSGGCGARARSCAHAPGADAHAPSHSPAPPLHCRARQGR